MSVPLWKLMRDLADAGHERADDLRRHADDLEEKSGAYFGDPQTVTTSVFLGAWGRARLTWCECSGEPLV